MAVQRPTFKPYYQDMLIPPTLDELVRRGHPMRIASDVIDRINILALLDVYHIKNRMGIISNYTKLKEEKSCLFAFIRH